MVVIVSLDFSIPNTVAGMSPVTNYWHTIDLILCLHSGRRVKMSRVSKHLVMFDWNLDAMWTNAKNLCVRDGFVRMGST